MESLGPITQEEFGTHLRQIEGYFDQAHWRMAFGFRSDQLATDCNGEVVGLLITPAHSDAAGMLICISSETGSATTTMSHTYPGGAKFWAQAAAAYKQAGIQPAVIRRPPIIFQ